MGADNTEQTDIVNCAGLSDEQILRLAIESRDRLVMRKEQYDRIRPRYEEIAAAVSNSPLGRTRRSAVAFEALGMVICFPIADVGANRPKPEAAGGMRQESTAPAHAMKKRETLIQALEEYGSAQAADMSLHFAADPFFHEKLATIELIRDLLDRLRKQ